MTPEQVVKHFDGSISFTAYNLGYSETAIRGWVKEGVIPPKPQKLIEALTAGKLKADKEKK